MKDVIDLTLPLGPGLPLYPGDPPPEAELVSSLSDGDLVTASRFRMGAHVGTHVDLPAHFVEGGKALGGYAVDAFLGPAAVLDLTDLRRAIDEDRLAREILPEDRHILLKTRNSSLLRSPGFCDDFVFLEPDAAVRILARKPRSIGIDYYSLDPADTRTFPSHRLCAEQGVPVFVCLDLGRAAAGAYEFAGLPLSYPALEGAPVRAILWRD